ncbi:hypothetical protein BCV70DRAFT_202308 [Testicularia cyperi]|uniref:Uncharacterized protein n=1 Tax=Testicularia cyperi TaxID=1882483 RepID=A0A317XIT3_9BASI|nr:hypothetical protein BCV70DRAFT_202308 [Testicularia cyperi]
MKFTNIAGLYLLFVAGSALASPMHKLTADDKSQDEEGHQLQKRSLQSDRLRDWSQIDYDRYVRSRPENVAAICTANKRWPYDLARDRWASTDHENEDDEVHRIFIKCYVVKRGGYSYRIQGDGGFQNIFIRSKPNSGFKWDGPSKTFYVPA